MASGPSLTFISLPRVFASMGGVGRIVGIVFFLALGFAALTSCVSVMETLVANCMELFHKSRKQMCTVIGLYSLVTAVLICLGYNALYFELPLPNGSVGQLLDVMDYISNSFLMPFISLLTSILIGWIVGPKWICDEVQKNGEPIELTQVEYHIMEYLLKNRGTALDRKTILHHIWGEAYYGDDKVVDVNIRRLRMKIEDDPSDPQYIQTIWGFGYKWNG